MTAIAGELLNPVDAYAHQVTSGEVPAGKYHRLACERHLRDRARENTPGFPYRFIWEARDDKGRLVGCALRFLQFAGKMRHYKGRQFAGQLFEPTPYQVFTLGSVFGWRHVDTGYRRFTTSYKEVPRKQGKSFEEAIVGVYCTFFEDEPGADGYYIATKEKQARIAFDAAKKLVKASGLSARIQVNAANMNREVTSQKLEPLGSDSDTTDGLSPHFIGIDELHAFKHRGLLDVMESGTGARVNPMNFQITTAGNNPVSPCGDQHAYVCQILDGVLEDDPSTLSFFGFIAHAEPEDDPWSEETWRKANPHWGGSVNPDDMRKLAAKAQRMPSAAAEFKQKRLNLWVNAFNPCLSLEGWRAGQNPDKLTREAWIAALEHQPCFVGIDLASKIDLCCCSFVFPPSEACGRWRWLQYIWTPADTLKDRAHRDRAPYDRWRDDRWLTATPGTQIDHQLVRTVLKENRARFDISHIGFDPWHADTLITQLVSEDGFPETQVLAVPQTYQGMSSACLKVQAEILGANVDACACPVTAWSVSNCVDQRDGKDNMMFVKKKSRGRIDPVIAPTIGTSLALRMGTAAAPAEPQLVSA